MKRAQDEAAPSALVPLPFITGHDPFEQMAATAAAADSVAAKGKRALA